MTQASAAKPGNPVPPLPWRDRVHAATAEEVKRTARRLLAERGPEGMSLRAIAREMGMTAPAIYSYFGHREELFRHVIADIYIDVARALHDAVQAIPVSADSASSQAEMAARLVAVCQGFRAWAVGHKGEFGLLFGAPLPGLDDGRGDIADECGREFTDVFVSLFLGVWAGHPFAVPQGEEIDRGLREQLERFRDWLGVGIPIGAVLVFLRCWTRLYGAVSMEVFGHLGFALTDPAPMFDITVAELRELMGLRLPGAVGLRFRVPGDPEGT